MTYSFHLGSDKNKSKLAKKVAKENLSGTTSLSNNAIQNEKDLSDVNKHNLRDYDNQRELIRMIYGTNDIVNDVKQVYLDEFEDSPHMHIVGVPVVENCNRGMKKQLGKSKLFTKSSLTEIQDKMRNACIKSYNKFYEVDIKLKEKQKGRNQDINVKDMGDYRNIKKQLEQKEKRLTEANNQTKTLENKNANITKILDNLKPTKLNKNNMLISARMSRN